MCAVGPRCRSESASRHRSLQAGTFPGGQRRCMPAEILIGSPREIRHRCGSRPGPACSGSVTCGPSEPVTRVCFRLRWSRDRRPAGAAARGALHPAATRNPSSTVIPTGPAGRAWPVPWAAPTSAAHQTSALPAGQQGAARQEPPGDWAFLHRAAAPATAALEDHGATATTAAGSAGHRRRLGRRSPGDCWCRRWFGSRRAAALTPSGDCLDRRQAGDRRAGEPRVPGLSSIGCLLWPSGSEGHRATAPTLTG